MTNTDKDTFGLIELSDEIYIGYSQESISHRAQ